MRVTEPTVFQEVHASPAGSRPESDAFGIVVGTNPPGIDSSKTHEAGILEANEPETNACSATPGCTDNGCIPQEWGPEGDLPPAIFPETDAPECGATVKPCLVSQCLEAFDALPHISADASKESHRDQVQKSFYGGMYTHGGVSDLRSTCRGRAQDIQVFTSLMRAVHPELLFTCLVVLEGAQSSLHKDARNACVPNLLIPLTHFSGGELLLEKPGGRTFRVGECTVQGESVSLSKGPVAFNAHVRHAGLPPHDRRVVLVAYCLKGVTRLTPEARLVLEHLGFNVPQSEPVEVDLPPWTSGFPDLRPLGFRPQPVADALPALRSRRLLFIELCCGSAGLSAAFRSLGFQVLAIDHSHNRHQPQVPCLALDLRLDSSWSFVERMVTSRATLLVHIAPPCGTASKKAFRLRNFPKRECCVGGVCLTGPPSPEQVLLF